MWKWWDKWQNNDTSETSEPSEATKLLLQKLVQILSLVIRGNSVGGQFRSLYADLVLMGLTWQAAVSFFIGGHETATIAAAAACWTRGIRAPYIGPSSCLVALHGVEL